MERTTGDISVGSLLSVAAVCVACLAMGVVSCNNDTAGAKSCSKHSDCDVGYACGKDGSCVQTACDDVPGEGCGEEDLVCIETDDFPQGVCSKPECETASDCDDPGAVCADGVCQQEECSSEADCDAGERCNAFGQCTPSGTDTGTTTDAGVDGDGGSVDGGSDTGDVTYECDEEPKNCPTSANPDADKWSERYCACVECTGDSDCENDGEECRAGTCQPECTQECDSASGGESCSGDKPFCIADCCVECVGKMDCDEEKLCVDGQCQEGGGSGDCSDGDCPEGYSCNSDTGKCEEGSSGQQCSQNDPTCPEGEFCNTDTGKCEAVSGGDDCGGCNAGCTCPGSMSCDQQLLTCTGCNPFRQNCPGANQICLPFGGQNVCL